MGLQSLRFRLDALAFLDGQDTNRDRLVELEPGQLLVWQPEAVGALFRSDHGMVTARSSTMGPIGGRHSLLFANGERHAAYRKAIGTRLRGRVLAGYQDVIREVADEAVHELDQVVDLPEWSRAVTLQVISRILFGQYEEDFMARCTAWLDGVFGTRRQTLVYRYFRPSTALPSPWRTFLRQRAALCDEVQAMSARPGSLLEVLRDGAPPLGPMSGEDITDQILSLMFAGHETTASSITSTLYWLSRDAALRADITREVRHGDAADPSQVPLLEAACREALRISPPAMVAGNRVLTDDTDTLGRHMPAGTVLTPCVYAAHRDPENYPQPHRFDPERFLGQRQSPQHYLPFGGGSRRCLGADLASLELRMIVAAVLRDREVRVLRPDDATFAMRGQALCFGPKLLASVSSRRAA